MFIYVVHFGLILRYYIFNVLLIYQLVCQTNDENQHHIRIFNTYMSHSLNSSSDMTFHIDQT